MVGADLGLSVVLLDATNSCSRVLSNANELAEKYLENYQRGQIIFNYLKDICEQNIVSFG